MTSGSPISPTGRGGNGTDLCQVPVGGFGSAWMWTSADAAAALHSRQLGKILRAYRRVCSLSQGKLADRLGYDTSYISMLETGRRSMQDVVALRHVAKVLAVPPHFLGVTDQVDTDYQAMVAFAESAIHLAEAARSAGRADDAIGELWTLTARLEARAAAGYLEVEALTLLARARTSLGVCLGTVLPEERLHAAVSWTAGGVRVTRLLPDDSFGILSRALQMYGNELRKVGRDREAVRTLREAAQVAPDDVHRGAALALLARAAAQAGDAGLFDSTSRAVTDLLPLTGPPVSSVVSHPYAWHEIRLRGLLDLGRRAAAITLAATDTDDTGTAPAPQWSVIAAVTMAAALLASGDGAAEARLVAALEAAVQQRLPHQAQRVARLARQAGRDDVAEQAEIMVAAIVDQAAGQGQAVVPTGSRCGGKT